MDLDDKINKFFIGEIKMIEYKIRSYCLCCGKKAWPLRKYCRPCIELGLKGGMTPEENYRFQIDQDIALGRYRIIRKVLFIVSVIVALILRYCI